MKRLTKRMDDGSARYNHTAEASVTNDALLTRLAYYEDLEEQGRLVVLPCKVGDKLYITEPRFYNYEKHEGVQNGVCEGYELDDRFGWIVKVSLEKGEPHTLYFYNFSKFGKTVFLTREEAEKALKEYSPR